MFTDCYNPESISLLASVTDAVYAFFGCISLTNAEFTEDADLDNDGNINNTDLV